MFAGYETEARFAVEAVEAAARLCRDIQREIAGDLVEKEDRSPVTVADFASQALIGRRLRQAYPQEPLVAEEGSDALRTQASAHMLQRVTSYIQRSEPDAGPPEVCEWIDHGLGAPEGRYWVLDPIDGTKGFLRGDQYVVALALVEGGQVVLGALACPNLNTEMRPDFDGPGSIVIAVRGTGTWTTPMGEEQYRRLQVSASSSPADARMLRSFESGHTNVDQLARLEDALGLAHPPVKMDSQAKYAVLAGARGEVLFRLLSPEHPDYREKIWDQAAGSIIIQEAGGSISDLLGRPLDFTAGRTLQRNVGILATNGKLHAAALEALDAIGFRSPSNNT